MDEKKPFANRMEAFFAGKGFYIVLTLCVAVIGVSAWSMFSGGEVLPDESDVSVSVANMDEDIITETMVKPTPVPSASPVPTAAPENEAPCVEEAENEASAAAADYYIYPVTGEIDVGYSMAALTFNQTMRDWRTHDGLDIAAEVGTQVKAAANGRVTAIEHDDLFGTTVTIAHQNGLESVYSNLADTPTVSVGDSVGVSQVIGAVGTSALCETGQVAHLHFAMRCNGESVDPMEYLPY